VSDVLRLLSPAKLNLFLHITGRRADGYHTLQTVFQLIDLCDTLEFEPAPGPGVTLEGGPPGLALEHNLVFKAALLLAGQRGPGTAGVHITLRKRIPHGAGLGGGSSDAATTLLALNKLWHCGLDIGQLAALGLQLGADVPVFVRGHSAWAEGIGEQLQPLELPQRWFLVLRPGCAVNTAAIFQDRELTRNTPITTIAAFLANGGRNDCESLVKKRYPEVARALEWLGTRATARMSGTGSCVFADFSSEQAATEAAAQVPLEWECFVARGINRSMVHEALFD
jgi:4-diphosphocytidyl-2-C-methyl-D-erythritol kinase